MPNKYICCSSLHLPSSKHNLCNRQKKRNVASTCSPAHFTLPLSCMHNALFLPVDTHTHSLDAAVNVVASECFSVSLSLHLDPHQPAHEADSVFFLPVSLSDCPVFPKLVRTLNGGLHMMVILFLLVAVGFALVSLSFCIYNARKVPYQSIKGHKGLYLWNFIAGTLSSLFPSKISSFISCPVFSLTPLFHVLVPSSCLSALLFVSISPP